MGVAKAALEASVRYLAADLGPREHPRERDFGGSDQDARGGRHLGLLDHPAGLPRARAAPPRTWSSPKSPTPRVFLLSPASRAITGEILMVDGGYPRQRRRSPLARALHSSIRFALARLRALPAAAASPSTSAGGPQTKHSVAGSCTSGLEHRRAPIRPRPPVQLPAPSSRVTVCVSSMRPRVGQRRAARPRTRTRRPCARCREARCRRAARSARGAASRAAARCRCRRR